MIHFFMKSIRTVSILALLRRVMLSAIPPKSADSLMSEASQIVVGKVQGVYHREVPVRHGSNHEFVASFRVVRNETEFSVTLPEVIYIHYWQTGDRPKGWTGPMGQYNSLPENKEIRVYLQTDSKNQFQLMEPNGWQSV